MERVGTVAGERLPSTCLSLSGHGWSRLVSWGRPACAEPPSSGRVRVRVRECWEQH